MNLARQRLDAAIASKGISSEPIRAMALRLLARHQPCGSFLDYGAGVGDLLREIAALAAYSEMAGVDILSRPENLSESIEWFAQDLNSEFFMEKEFDVVVSTEVIEHLENPRATFRNIHRLLKPGGIAIITTPNQNSIRSFATLIFAGHFSAFLGASYPAHITALTILDLMRISKETNFEVLDLCFTDSGGIPKFPGTKWQDVSFGLLRGQYFSDNVAVVVRKPAA